MCSQCWEGHQTGGRRKGQAGDHGQASNNGVMGPQEPKPKCTLHKPPFLTSCSVKAFSSNRVSPQATWLLAPELFINNLPLPEVHGQSALHLCILWSPCFWQAEWLNGIWWNFHLSNCLSLLQLLSFSLQAVSATWLSKLCQLIQVQIH